MNFNFYLGGVMKSFGNINILFKPESTRIQRVEKAKAFLELVKSRMNGNSIVVELDDTSDSFYRLLGSMEVTNGEFVVTRTWFGFSKKKIRITRVDSIGSYISLVPSKKNSTEKIFEVKSS